MVTSDDGPERKGVGVGVSVFTFGMPVSDVPQSSVLGHCLASGSVAWSQLDVLHVTAPGVPDLPAGTPHLLAHPRGSACIQLPNSA